MERSFPFISCIKLQTALDNILVNPRNLTYEKAMEYSLLATNIKQELQKYPSSRNKDNCYSLIAIIRLNLRSFFARHGK